MANNWWRWDGAWMTSNEELGMSLPLWVLWVQLIRRKPMYGDTGGEVERDVRYYVMGLN